MNFNCSLIDCAANGTKEYSVDGGVKAYSCTDVSALLGDGFAVAWHLALIVLLA